MLFSNQIQKYIFLYEIKNIQILTLINSYKSVSTFNLKPTLLGNSKVELDQYSIIP
jgi:hypothetical protein